MADPFESQIPIKPEQIIDILVRRKWLIVIPLCITLTLGLFKTLTATKTYEASTLILVQPQKVPTNYVKSIVTSTISQRISTISQQILSRSNLEKIIDQFGLYEDSVDMYLEDKIESMRKRVKVKIDSSRSGADAFSIVFTGSDPQRVMRVANTLASYFMDENLKVREAQAVGTSEFLEAELEKTKNKLEEREQRLSAYKRKHIGGLPSELQTNLNTMNRLQAVLATKSGELRSAKEALASLEGQIAQAKETTGNTTTDAFASFEFEEETFEQSEDEKKLEVAKKGYETLLLTYTEKHPDVAKLKKTIEKLEKSIAEEKEAQKKEAEEKAKEQPAPEAEEKPAEELPNFALLKLEERHKLVLQEIKKITSDIAKIERQMQFYQKRVEDTPKRELELQSLQRDYANIKDVYESLLQRKLEAELSVTMEKKQKGEQFRILDHARLPEKPISPNVKMLFALSVAAGLGIGGAVIFLLEFFDGSIRRDDQIEKDLGLDILAIIPPLRNPNDGLKKKVNTLLFVGCSLYAVAFLAFFAILNAKGLDRSINFIKSTLNM